MNKIMLLVGFVLSLSACQNRTIDKLLPDTINFLEHQEKARCACLDVHGQALYEKLDEGILYMKALPQKYDMDNLSPQDMAVIRSGISGSEALMRIVMPCVHQRTQETYKSDQLTQMLIAQDFKTVLQLDSLKTEAERQEKMLQPSLEMMDDLCPQHKKVIIKLQEFLKTAEILPASMQ